MISERMQALKKLNDDAEAVVRRNRLVSFMTTSVSSVLIGAALHDICGWHAYMVVIVLAVATFGFNLRVRKQFREIRQRLSALPPLPFPAFDSHAHAVPGDAVAAPVPTEQA